MNKSFLLVDDDADDAAIFLEALSAVAALNEFHTAENGLILFEVLLGLTPDVIFLDINMPKMSGWECLKKLKNSSEYNHIPVIMYSTSSAKKDVAMACSLGAALFITKPEEFKELYNILMIVGTGLQAAQITRLKEYRSIRVCST